MFLRKPEYNLHSTIMATIDEIFRCHNSNEYNNEAVNCLLCLVAGSDNPKQTLNLICNNPQLKASHSYPDYFSYTYKLLDDEDEWQSFLSRWKKLDLPGFNARMKRNEELEAEHNVMIRRKS